MLLFVYGTLKRGHQNHAYFLNKAGFLGEAETIERFCLKDLGAYPAVLDNSKVSTIKGELFNVNEEEMQNIDHLEGYPHLYTKINIKVKVAKNATTSAIMYVAADEVRNYLKDRKTIESGVWEGE